MANYHRNTLILTAEPFVGFMPVDLYAWVNEHSSDRDIAVALAEVHNHVGILGHDLDEVDDQYTHLQIQVFLIDYNTPQNTLQQIKYIWSVNPGGPGTAC